VSHRKLVRPRVTAALAAAAIFIPLVSTNAGAAPSQDPSTPSTPPTQDDLKLNQLQFLGTHNSYHLPPDKGLYDFAKTVAPDGLNPNELLYEHAPLPDQFSNEGIRQIELDVSADPDGGRFANPAANILQGVPPYNADYTVWDPPELMEPGTKVLHIPDFDMRTTCVLLTQCLEQVKTWSAGHPGHFPIAVLMELKDEEISGDFPIDLVTPLPYTTERLNDLDAEIRSVFDDDEIFTPDDLRGDAATLPEVVTGAGWPDMATMRGQTMFLMDNGGAIAERYKEGHPALEGRVMFTSGTPGQPDAAFVKLNDPFSDAQAITDAVDAGYVVRTRADTPISQAQSGDTAMQRAAFASGAQWVSTDYPVPGLTELLGTYGLPFADYVSPLPPNESPPGGSAAALRSPLSLDAKAAGPQRVARCNPVSAPAFCYDVALTEPEPPAPPPAPTPPTGSPSTPNGPSSNNGPAGTGNGPSASGPGSAGNGPASAGNGPGSNGNGPGGGPGPGGRAPGVTPLAPSFTG
jgi:hypothetical protein